MIVGIENLDGVLYEYALTCFLHRLLPNEIGHVFSWEENGKGRR